MYDIRQFRPTLYLLLLMGVTGFALAAESPAIWIVAAGGIMLNAWLVKTDRFVPMSRVLANLVTLVALAVVTFEVRAGDSTPILTIGNFIVLLHLVKLFELRANRDYGQLLVLSLLLMVAAAISTASLLFGLLFIAYLFVSLHCCLLFHLKVEVDQARALYRQPADHVNPALLRQDIQDLPRSMRRLTGLIAATGIAMAVVVFIFFPRGAGSTFLGPLQMSSSQALSGFNDQVAFQDITRITKSEDVVARVELYHNGEKMTHPTELMLRGSVLDIYTGSDVSHGRWQWRRSSDQDPDNDSVEGGSVASGLRLADPGNSRERWKQVINLQPTATNKLFAMAGPIGLASSHDMQIRFFREDGVLEAVPPVLQPIQYTVVSTNELPAIVTPIGDGADASEIDPAVAKYARQPAICGTDSAGKPLAEYALSGNHQYDHLIAANFERDLRTNFGYTLDLTDIGPLGNRDPMAAFLTDFKRGHCEYFAGAMTLMCQSLGIPARFVVGFRCEPEDFNSLGDYFVVKESNAHAWCEVYTGQKWETFDPTSGRGAQGKASHPYIAGMKKLFDYLEFKWASTVVAYDTSNRKNLIDTLDVQMTKSAVDGSQNVADWVAWIQRKLDSAQKEFASPTVLSCVITGMITLSFVAVSIFIFERLRLHRRARRIGIELLSTPDQYRLARQLRFYDDVLRILAKHHIERPRHLTPLEFSRSLSYLPSEVYRDIYRLTELFYRIRYGKITLPAHPRRHLSSVVYRIQQTLDGGSRDRL
jgi:transglutaminase-like putative cysteine protease